MNSLASIVQETNFSGLDWGIVVLYLVVSVAIGFIARRYVADMADYVVAGRGIRTALGIATLTGTELGLVTVMYSAEKGFTGGFAAFHIGLAAGVVCLFVGLTGFIVADLRKHEVLTIPEYYGKRFGPRTRILGGIVLAAGGILNMGMFLKAGSMFIVGVTGLPGPSTLALVMMILLALVLFYTILGGMVSVVVTDYIQFVVLSFGLILATVIAIMHLGWSNILLSMVELKGEAGFNPLLAQSSFGIDYVVWMLFLGLVNCALWPTGIARALAAESTQVVKRQYRWASVSFTIRNIVPYFWGICAFILIMQTPKLKEAFFPSNGETEAVNFLYAMPVLMGRILPAGLIGIITAAMIAAFMSTHDSYFLCWSSVITNDVIAPLAGGKLSQKDQVTIARILILVIGVLIFLVSFLFPLKEDLWDYMAVSGAIYFSGAFALLVGGLYWKRASSAGAVLAVCCGCLAIFGLKAVKEAVLGRFLSQGVLEELTSARVGLGVIGMTSLAMIIGSLVLPDRPRTEKENL